MSTAAMPGFCPDCGSILPPLKKAAGGVTCYLCEKEHDVKVFGDMYVEYTVPFNKRSNQADEEEDSDKEEGPVVDRVCRKCGNTKMSYATLQLRSADEGQTVFFTCTKCNFKESENS